MTTSTPTPGWRDQLKQKNQSDFQSLKELQNEHHEQIQSLLNTHLSASTSALDSAKSIMTESTEQFLNNAKKQFSKTSGLFEKRQSSLRTSIVSQYKESLETLTLQHSRLLKKTHYVLLTTIFSTFLLITAMGAVGASAWFYMQQQQKFKELEKIGVHFQNNGDSSILVLPGRVQIQRTDDNRTIIKIKES